MNTEIQDLTSPLQSSTDLALEEKIRNHLDDLTKPQGSLGLLENLALKYCLSKKQAHSPVTKMALFTFAGDHGIKEENITPFPQEVTQQMVVNMAQGGAAVAVMCRQANIDYKVVDIGVKGVFPDMDNLIKNKIRKGTRNLAKESAMTENECNDAFKVGYDIGYHSNVDLVGVGEMGIGNTSSASALYSLILGISPDETVGMGTGSVDKMLALKKKVIKAGVDLHRTSWQGSAYEALQRVGGFEIAGMCGLMFGCAQKRIPVVVDGFIATAASLVAIRINPVIKDYLFFAHQSAEKFHKEFLAQENIRPILSLDMRLGEGSGAVLAMQIMQQALACYHEMATFSGARVSKKEE